MKSVMAHDFAKAPTIDAPRSSFDRSFGYKTTFDAGYLIPFYVDDVLPGDTFTLNTTGFARLTTPLKPLMDNMYMDTHFFFCPLRLLWQNSRKFFGEQDNPADSIDYTLPVFNSFTPADESLSDYMGLPPGNAMTPVSLYHRAYNFIWNQWFRDQNLQDSVVVDIDDGPDDIADYVLKKRGKRYDYFTSALPNPQKGEAVSLPLGTTADVIPRTSPSPVPVFEDAGTGAFATQLRMTNASATTTWFNTPTVTGNAAWNDPALEVDLSTATAATINDLREAFQVQKLLERDARGGTRYSELVKNHFSVKFYDVSYRPEFLGGGSTPVNITPVAQTGGSEVAVSTPQANLAGFGTAAFSGHGFTKSFVEHGIIIGLVSVRADLTYQQGIPKHFLKSTRYDMYWPSLAHLGEQVVENQEIYHQNTAADTDAFGYQERYAEYRFKPSQITSRMRSSYSSSLDVWHLSQEFSSLPVLGNTFIEETPPIDRVLAVQFEPHFIFDSHTQLRCARPMPVFGVPGMIDHF